MSDTKDLISKVFEDLGFPSYNSYLDYQHFINSSQNAFFTRGVKQPFVSSWMNRPVVCTIRLSCSSITGKEESVLIMQLSCLYKNWGVMSS